jgi:rhamnose transport system ATP-binding protein
VNKLQTEDVVIAEGEMNMSDYVLELRGITKIFPGIKALDDVHFQLKKGEIHALMGENGAGKSTFIKVITGVHKAEKGSMFLDGREVNFKNPKEAQAAGIAAIYQHVTAYPHLSVTENIFMGHEKVQKGTGRILWKQMHKEANALLKELCADFDATAEMGSLSVAQQQMVEIAKALSMNAKIIIMDEPTAALTKRESEELYKIAEKLRDEGASIIFISHRFEDMYRLATRVTVFRDSKYIGSYNVDEISNEDLIVAMVGREINQLFPKPEITPGEVVLQVNNISRTGFFKDVSFQVRKGEILGLTGLVGAGRTEVCESIFGVAAIDEGSIFLNGKEIRTKDPLEAMKLGIGYLPEDRQKQGLILDWGIGQNITLPVINSLTRKGILNDKKERELGKKLAEKVDTKAVTIFDKASSLSGGNQQKVVVAKLLASDLKVLILDEPTKGVDVGAKAAIYEIMGELASQGYAIIMVSSEMPEILGMSDRIVVMCDGRVTGEFKRGEATQESILEKGMAKVCHCD